MSKCPVCGYYAFNGVECFDCGYRRAGWKSPRWFSCLLVSLLLAGSLATVKASRMSAAEPSPRICAGIEQALADLLTLQALKTAEQIVQAQADVGLTDQERLAIAQRTTWPAILQQVRAKYDPTIKARAKVVLLLAGCP